MRLIRLTEVRNLTALSRSAIYRKMKAKEFPQTVNLSDRSDAWLESEVTAWIREVVSRRG